jgi:hypothetical protein
MSHATKPAGLPWRVQRPQRARVPVLIPRALAAASCAGGLAKQGNDEKQAR